MYLDLHTYLGMNTMLTEPSLVTLESDRNMPNDTLIVDLEYLDRRMDAIQGWRWIPNWNNDNQLAKGDPFKEGFHSEKGKDVSV